MTPSPVLILGAGSDIARATALRFAAKGHTIRLAARDPEAIEPVRADIALRHGVEVTAHRLDVLEPERFDAFLDGLPELPEVVVCAVGLLGEQTESAAGLAAATRVLRSNFEGPALLLGLIANRFEARGSGVIVGISSVAGDRGRASNYVYGAAKAGFTAFLSGLRNRLAKRGVHVVTVKPGFVNTAMTAGLDLPGPLTAEPDEVARAILRAVAKGRNVVYVRSVWWAVMSIIRAIPEPIFKKLSL